MFSDSLSYGVWPVQYRPLFSSDSQAMVVPTVIRDGGDGLFVHIMMVSITSSMQNQQIPLTIGTYTVTKLLAWDTNRNLV